MARNSSGKRGTGRKTYSIVVDGETEKWYLDMLRRNTAISTISIQPEIHNTKSLKDQYETVRINAGSRDVSVWVIDLDKIISDGKIREFEKQLNKLKKISNVHVLVNTPCLEFWFLQHVKDTGIFYDQCGTAQREFKKHNPLKEYEKKERYFVNANLDIYKRLKPHLNTAIANAKKRGDFDINNPHQAKAEMYKIFDILGIEIPK